MPTMMKAAIFVEPGRIEIDDKPIPDIGPNDALMRVTTTTICGTDVHILKGEYPVERGLTIGHEPVGVIEKLGANVKGYQEGQRVIAGAICPALPLMPARMAAPRKMAATTATAINRWAAGALATPLTAPRRNTYWCPMPRPTSRPCRMA